MVACSLLIFTQKIIFTVKKIHKNCCKQSCSFGSDINQTARRLGLCPTPHWGSLQCSPRRLAVFRGPKEGERAKSEKGKEREEGEEKKGEEGCLLRWHPNQNPNVLLL